MGYGPVDGALYANVPEVDAVGVDAHAGDEAVGAAVLAAGSVEQEKECGGGVVDEGDEEGRRERVGFRVGVAVNVETPEADYEDGEKEGALLLELVEALGPEGVEGCEGDADEKAVEASLGVEVDFVAVEGERGAQALDGERECDAGG